MTYDMTYDILPMLCLVILVFITNIVNCDVLLHILISNIFKSTTDSDTFAF